MTFEITSMLKPGVYQHPVGSIELIETHISWVVLTGEFAYKIKKPVNYGFLDFSTLQKRENCCKEEVRLNTRLAPQIYLEVVGISGEPSSPKISMDNVFEYSVKMKQFPQSAQLDNMLKSGQLTLQHMDRIADMVATFHQQISIAEASVDYGSPHHVMQPVEENLLQIEQHMDTHAFTPTLNLLKHWIKSESKKLKQLIILRKQDGYIRECHGDMHLRNMLWLNNTPQAFDCIEFNPYLRWIDVISEVAFLVMDLQDRQQYPLAQRFLNRYLENTGDYNSLRLLPFYLCYRAMVRAKVCALRLEQSGSGNNESKMLENEFTSYLQLASNYTQQSTPAMIIMRGLSASGKSTLSQQLVDISKAIRIRSDIERKRLFNIVSTQHVPEEKIHEVYSTEATDQTYSRLLQLAEHIIEAGYSVVIDATFQQYSQRKPFEEFARKMGIPCTIVQLEAPIEVLQKRIKGRRGTVSDADSRVLEEQYRNYTSLEPEEMDMQVTIDTTKDINLENLLESISVIKYPL